MKLKNTITAYRRAIKRRMIGIPFGERWQGKDTVLKLEKQNELLPLSRSNFISYFTSKKDVKTVLEVGCGSGTYPIKYPELFINKDYTGIDISRPAIKYCKEKSNLNFICGDFQKMELGKKYDLIFSLSVVESVYDIDNFITKIVENCTKYAYIFSHKGYHTELENHKMVHDRNKGYYSNLLSINQIRKTLLKAGLSEIEFVIVTQESGHPRKNIGTLIKIDRTQQQTNLEIS